MYRVLIATNEPNVLDRLNASVEWESLGFYQPSVVNTAMEAIREIETKRVDCIAYMLGSEEARRLSNYLNTRRPSLPIFEMHRNPEHQKRVLHDMRHVLDRLRMDMSDEELDEDMILSILRDELTHNLLAGGIMNGHELHARLQMLRSHLSENKKCVIYEFDLPQGEVYLTSQWHYGSERLENALRSNFFGRYYEDLYYIVAVLTPRHIRLVVCQRDDTENEPDESLIARADSRVAQVLESIKEYLGLDMVLTQRDLLSSLRALTEQ